jgi:16S rRNA (cytidine1402-2'-O)-methyltransferase
MPAWSPCTNTTRPSAAARIVADMRAGKSVAYISDAGTPGISDPGARLVGAARAGQVPIVPIPGASAVAAALSVSGLDGTLAVRRLPAGQGFRPPQGPGRSAPLPCALVFYEAPHRIEECVADLLARLGGERNLLIARELTKRFEQIHQCLLADAPAWLAADDDHRRGEFVLVVSAPAAGESDDAPEARRVLEILLEELPVRQAAQLAARITGGRKNTLYDLALK